jgi:sugar phosphate isomerase/epimerase
MSNPVFAHLPYHLLGQYLNYILEGRINPELFFNGDALDGLVTEELVSVAEALQAGGIQCTIHAPFMDLNPGSPEILIRRATEQRFRQVMDAAEILKPVVMVFHPGYDRWRQGESQQEWLGYCIETFKPVLDRAQRIGTTIAVENIFETEPSTLKGLLDALDSPLFRHCFDVGHWNLFKSISMEDWFSTLGRYIAEVHLHDNHGSSDEHLPIDDGSIDFNLYFRLMKKYAPQAAYTIEAHDRNKVTLALERLAMRLDANLASND